MKLHWLYKHGWLGFVILMPLLITGADYFIFSNEFSVTRIVGWHTLLICLVCAFAWYSYLYLATKIKSVFSASGQGNIKSSWLILIHLLMVLLVVTVYFVVRSGTIYFNQKANVQQYIWSVIMTFLVTSVFTTAWEYLYKEKIVADEPEEEDFSGIENPDAFDVKISSHFLYNSLDSLSILIDENPGEAEVFVDEMSKIYRYRIQHEEAGLNTLANEIMFIKSYFYLLKARFGKAIQLDLDISEDFMNRLIPTHTLQVLVDDVIQRNSLLKEKPLHISFETNGKDQLVIRHSRQPKLIKVKQSKRGILYIQSRYRIMNEKIKIKEDNSYVHIVLPLLPDESQIVPAEPESSRFAHTEVLS